MENNNTRKMVLSAVFCALVYVATWLSIPTPPVGNINLGDCIIILSANILGGPWAVAASAIGAMLCDLSSGYGMYAPATFIIKGFMVVIILSVQKNPTNKLKSISNIGFILSALCAEAFMVCGYYLYESVLLGLGKGALANIPFNAIQGGLNIVIATLVYVLVLKNVAHVYKPFDK